MSTGLFLHMASVEAKRRMSYRVDFWINAVVTFAIQFAIVWFLWKAMFAESGRTVIGGFTFDQILVYYVVAILVGKLVRGTEFEGQPSTDIYEGGLNRYLLLPANYFGLKYAQALGSLVPALMQLLIFGVSWWLITSGRGFEDVSVGSALMALGSLVLANLLYYLAAFTLHAVAFWADNVWSLLVALRFLTGLLGGLMFPLALFPQAIQDINHWLPFRLLFALPAESLLGHVPFDAWLQSMAIGVVWLGLAALLARAVWRRGTLQYSGIGI